MNQASSKETVLIVDDEQIVRRLLHQKLANDGYGCVEAGSVDDALNVLSVNREIALVVSDMKMPGKSGMDLLAEVKANYPDTAVIIATAVNETATAIECMKQGAYDYLTKPFKLDEVTFSIWRALDKRRLQLENREYRQHLETKVEQQAEKIRASFFNAITALAHALDAKDGYTAGHSQRVSEIAVGIGIELELGHEQLESLRLAGMVHDIGKIGIDGTILHKPGILSSEERIEMEKHPAIGEHILAPVVEDTSILAMVRNHHERWDGGGYPDGLAATGIPLGARILALADTFDAMTSERPYRIANSLDFAVSEITRCSGSQFDPSVVEAFIKARRVITEAAKD
ncbi:HD domain-containing phosphohydrolase [Dehalogenimonas alkenigignens]|uniref:Response regulator containing a CheY-like receiver domain and an HD-GYP domain n=1 Tax=Dehalogenimonas alkenigignens TaxID=1217799 RepID=A0A0W0GJ22_9CHLR|nr:HD domain-containing phosphohydrolase [Dehalogenimonas alkenigignens]KTB48520.1 Response regulator containing a CheY-like receiver domain and an HD-GYP domain [Dehalogenimonas alkenigignens]PVV85032.1 HD domain-containing protein [Dehalogenimonas alkenigignens]